MSSPNPFNHTELRNWFFEFFESNQAFPNFLIVEGSTPFNQDELKNFLEKKNFTVVTLAKLLEGNLVNALRGIKIKFSVIVGNNDWSSRRLKEFIDACSEVEIKFYSQEMFLSFMETERDPFDMPYHFLKSFGQGHSALQFLSELGFDWPKMIKVTQGHSTFKMAAPGQGLLGYLGYKAGKSGKSTKERRELLRNVFHLNLNPFAHVFPEDYIEQWGTPQSAERLKKIAVSITKFHDNNLRYKEAAKDWRDDLIWLKNEFYRGHFTFRWPSPHVG